ncbi:MAG: aldo/keto reductase [Planctomycetota bacterium]|nr:aldo/keto reductase [Planctomycetota bacterium]
MFKRELPGTDLRLSAIGIGAFAIGGYMWGEQDDADSAAALRAAFAAGINWVDTAPLYGEGRASQVIGRVLRELPPSQRPLVFTKFGHHCIEGRRVVDNSPAWVERDCEEELRRLGSERLDLFQMHWPSAQPIDDTAEALARLHAAGKIRAIGLCNVDAAQLAAWRATGLPIACVQNGMSLVKPEPGLAVLPQCVAQGIGFLAHSPLHRGLLSGTWTADKRFPPGDHRGEREDFRGPRLARWLQAIEELRALAAEDELTVPQLAIGWLLCHEGVTAVIVGARNAAQGAALGELAMPLRQNQIDAIEAIVARCRADLAALRT